MDSKAARLSQASTTVGSSSFFVNRTSRSSVASATAPASVPQETPSPPQQQQPEPHVEATVAATAAAVAAAEEADDEAEQVEEEDDFSKKLASLRGGTMVIRAVVEDKDFKVRVAGNLKIEELCGLIEVEYLERYGHDEGNRALNCCLLLDEDAVPLEFGDVVGEVLADGALVYVVMTEIETPTSGTLYRSSKLAASAFSFSSATSDVKRNIDAEFKAILCNTIGLQYFKEFCVEEFCVENLLFWLDVETFRYCEADDNLVLAIAHRIYLNYISADGQLQINLNSDTKNAIAWPTLGVAKTIFDDAQVHVYSMMKGHTYRRFEQSEKNAELQKYMATNPVEYASAHIEDPKSFFSKSLEAAAQENSPMIQADSWTADQRDRTLTQHMMRYWKLNAEAKGYYEDKNKLTTKQKLRRMQREKRLKKFFGDTPDVPINKDFSRIESRPRLPSKDMPQDDVDEKSEIFARKKRAEKLEGFFGGKLPEQQLQEQNIRKDNPQQNEQDTAGSTRPLNLNNLTAEERRTYSKRSQKLKDILGDPISEGLASTITGQALDQITTGSLARRKSNYAKSRAFFEYGSQPEFSEKIPELRKSLMLDDESILLDLKSLPPPPVLLAQDPTQRPSSSRSLRSESQDDIETMLKEELFKKEGQSGRQKKELRRRKLVKLQTFLGERLSRGLQLQQNLINEPPLSTEEKKLQQKKIYKLGKVFGEMPPRELIIQPDDPWSVRQEKSLHALTYLLDGDNEQEIHELVMAMMEFEEEALDGGESSEKSKDKTLRQKKLNKLSHFFGDNVNSEVLVEQKILADIQQAMADDIASDDELRGLSAEVEELQLKIVRRASTHVKSPNLTGKAAEGSVSPPKSPPAE